MTHPLIYEELPLAGLDWQDLGVPEESPEITLFRLPSVKQNGDIKARYCFIYLEFSGTYHFRKSYIDSSDTEHYLYSPQLSRKEVRQYSYKYRSLNTYYDGGVIMGFDTRSWWQKYLDSCRSSVQVFEGVWIATLASLLLVLCIGGLGVAFTPLPFFFHVVWSVFAIYVRIFW